MKKMGMLYEGKQEYVERVAFYLRKPLYLTCKGRMILIKM